MRFTFVTLFPGIVQGYFEESILGRAKEAGHFSLDFVSPREYTTNKHLKVDEAQVGGGAGLLMNPQPLFDALRAIQRQSPEAYFLFPAPAGKSFVQNDAKRLAKKEHIVIVCGRYEGIDERVIETFADELFSIGDYVLTGGEVAGMVMCDAIARNVAGVLGNEDSLEEESFEEGLLEAPSFTKPNVFEKMAVPSEFLKGNHGKIAGLKKIMAFAKTRYFRPDLYLKNKK